MGTTATFKRKRHVAKCIIKVTCHNKIRKQPHYYSAASITFTEANKFKLLVSVLLLEKKVAVGITAEDNYWPYGRQQVEHLCNQSWQRKYFCFNCDKVYIVISFCITTG
jgi:hypothetical protein